MQNRVRRGTSYSLVQTLLLSLYRFATTHSITDGRTDRQTDDIVMTIGDHTVRSSTIG